MRGLRRDALHQVALTAVRRPADGGQQRPGAPPGGNLPTTPWTTDASGRGPACGFPSSRTPPSSGSLPARRRCTHPTCAPAVEHHQRRSGGRHPGRPAAPGVGAERPRDLVAELMHHLNRLDGPVALLSVVEHLVRRSVWIVRRRVGLRHGDRRARSRAVHRPQRERPGARHRGVLDRRPDVQVHAVGAVGEVRGRGQAHRPERPRLPTIAYGSVYVARVAMGRQSTPQTPLGLRRGRRLPRAVTDHRLPPLHRARHRHERGVRPQSGGGPAATGPSIRYDPMGAAGGNPFLLDSRGRASRWPLHKPASCATARSRRPTRPRPNGCTAWPEQSVGPALGRPTRRWRPAVRIGSRPTAERTPDVVGPTTWVLALAQPARSRRRRRCRQTVEGAAAWPTPASAPSCSTRSSRSRCATRPRWTARLRRGRHRELRRSAVVLPDAAEEDPGPAPYVSLLEHAVARRRRPGHRQPQRVSRRLGRLRPGHAGRRRRRDRAEHLLPPGPPAHLRPRCRAAAPRPPVGVKDAVTIPVGGQAGPHFSSTGEMAVAARRGRRGQTRALQPVPAARHRRRPLGRVVGVGALHPAEARLPRTWISLLRGRVRRTRSPPRGTSRTPPTSSSTFSPVRTSS